MPSSTSLGHWATLHFWQDFDTSQLPPWPRPFPPRLEAPQLALSSSSLGSHVPGLTARRLSPPLTCVHPSAYSRPITSVPGTTWPPPFPAPPSWGLARDGEAVPRPGRPLDTPSPERGSPAATARSPRPPPPRPLSLPAVRAGGAAPAGPPHSPPLASPPLLPPERERDRDPEGDGGTEGVGRDCRAQLLGVSGGRGEIK